MSIEKYIVYVINLMLNLRDLAAKEDITETSELKTVVWKEEIFLSNSINIFFGGEGGRTSNQKTFKS